MKTGQQDLFSENGYIVGVGDIVEILGDQGRDITYGAHGQIARIFHTKNTGWVAVVEVDWSTVKDPPDLRTRLKTIHFRPDALFVIESDYHIKEEATIEDLIGGAQWKQ